MSMCTRKTVLGAAAFVLALQGCSAGRDTPDASTSPRPFVSATPPASAGLGAAPAPSAAAALDGKRQVFFLPLLDDTELPDSVLAVTHGGRIQVTDNYDDSALFVPVPSARGAKERLIKTGTLRAGGKPFCLQVGKGTSTQSVVTAACDAGEPSQLFTFEASGEDDEGRTTYVVRSGGAFLQWHPLGETGLVAAELADSQPETTFALLDRGAAALPKAR
jgi:hypothetical protein